MQKACDVQRCIIYYFLGQKTVEILVLILYTFMFYEEHMHKLLAKYLYQNKNLVLATSQGIDFAFKVAEYAKSGQSDKDSGKHFL